MEKEYLIQIQLQTASDLLHKEDVQSALTLLEHLLDDHPNCFEALLMAGQCYLLLGSSLAAQDALHLCAQVLPQNEELLYALCIAHFEACCFESAMETARQILTLAPKSDLAWRYIGLSQVHLGNREEAVVAFEKANQINPAQNPMPLPTPNESVLDNVMPKLPPEIRQYYQARNIRCEKLPTKSTLLMDYIPMNPSTILYEDEARMLVTIYLQNLCYQYDSPETLPNRLLHALIAHAKDQK